jgi:hypothetical protein
MFLRKGSKNLIAGSFHIELNTQLTSKYKWATSLPVTWLFDILGISMTYEQVNES